MVRISGLFLVLALSGLALLGSSSKPEQASAAPLPKTDVCHVDDYGVSNLINISENAFPAHIEHGDATPGQAVPGKPGFAFNSTCAQIATCESIRDAIPTAPDGTYTIANGQSFQVYCHDMAGTPREFLEVDAADNYSQYTASFCAAGSNVRTEYSKIRLDPATLKVDISDQTFASSTGSLIHSSCSTGTDVVTFMPYGVAMSCDASPSGVGNLDLVGTPFKVVNAFAIGGSGPSGSTSKSSSDQVVALTGGGFCGWNSPDSSLFNPYNDGAGSPLFVLQLAFLP